MIDFASQPSLSDLEAPSQLLGRKAVEDEIRRQVDNTEGWFERRWNVHSTAFSTNLTTSTYLWAQEMDRRMEGEMLPDPNYSLEDFEGGLKRAVEEHGIHESFISVLERAHSEEHMQFLIQRAKERQEIYRKLGEYGVEGLAANFLWNIVDPVAIAVGGPLSVGTFGGIMLATKGLASMAQAARTSKVITAAGTAGLVSGVGVEAVRQAQGVDPVTEWDYIIAGGLGGLLGVGGGALLAHPEALRAINLQAFRGYARAAERAARRKGSTLPFLPQKLRENIDPDTGARPAAVPKIHEQDIELPDAELDITQGEDIPQPIPQAEIEVPNPVDPEQTFKIAVQRTPPIEERPAARSKFAEETPANTTPTQALAEKIARVDAELVRRAEEDLPANYADIQEYYGAQGRDVPLSDEQVYRASIFMEAGLDVEDAIDAARFNSVEDIVYSGMRFSPGAVTKEVEAGLDALETALDQVTSRLPDDVLIEVKRSLRVGGKDRAAYYSQRAKLIRVALNAENPVKALHHEEFHAFRDLDLITPEEWDTVRGFIKESNLREYYGTDAIYRNQFRKRYGGSPERIQEALDEEAAAEFWADVLAGTFDKPVPEEVKGIIARVQQALMSILRALRLVKDETGVDVGDLFRRSEAAEVFERLRSEDRTSLRSRSLDVAENPTVAPETVQKHLAFHGTRSSSQFTKFDISNSSDIGIHVGTLDQSDDFAGKFYRLDERTRARIEEGVTPVKENLEEQWDKWREQDSALRKKLRKGDISQDEYNRRNITLQKRKNQLIDKEAIMYAAANLEGARIFPVKIDIKNPIELPDLGSWSPNRVMVALEKYSNGKIKFTNTEKKWIQTTWDNKVPLDHEEIEFYARSLNFPPSMGSYGRRINGKPGKQIVREKIIKAGYDGIKYRNNAEGRMLRDGKGNAAYIIIKPGTAKSAISDTQLFSPQSTVGATQVATKPEMIKDPGLRSLQAVDDTPRSGFSGFLGFFNYMRFDRAAIGRSPKLSPLGRKLGMALMNDTVGNIDHSAAGKPAIIDAYQTFKKHTLGMHQAWKGNWRQYFEDNNLSPTFRTQGYNQFNDELFDYVQNLYPGTDYHPAVKAVGDEIRKMRAEILNDLKDPGTSIGQPGMRPVEGAQNIPEDMFSMVRKWHHAKIRSAVDALGQEPVIDLLAKGFRMETPTLTPDEAHRLATYFFRSVYGRASGAVDEWAFEVGRGNYIKFKQLLKNETNFSDQEIQQLMDKLTIQKPQADATNLRRKALISNRAEIQANNIVTGEQVTLRIKDLLDTDTMKLANIYARRMSGRIARARIRLYNANGNLVVDGITSDAEFDRLLDAVRQYHAERGSFTDFDSEGIGRDRTVQNLGVMRIGEIENLKYVNDRLLGTPDPNQMTDYAVAMRYIRKYMSARLMGQVGIAQAGETAFPIAHLGLRNAMVQMPALRRILDPKNKSIPLDELGQEIEAMGIGSERLHGFFWNTIDEVGDLPFEFHHTRSATSRMFEQGLDRMENAVYELSGMSFLQQQQQRWTAAMFINWFANTSKKFSKGDMRRLAQLGIDDQMLKRIQAQVDQHSLVEPSIMTGKKIRRLNLLQWNDLQARHALEHATFRAANKFIQTNDPSNSAWWMSRPMLQVLLQFRSFPQTAYANQFLYNLHMADVKSLIAFTSTMMWAAVMRSVQVRLNAVGRSDREAYEEKYLHPAELAKAGFERAGWGSILPGIIDQAAVWTGGESIFNARTSGDPTGLFSGSPAVSMLSRFQRGISGARRDFEGGPDISQSELRGFFQLMPFYNLIGMQNAINTMISGAPEKAPYKYGR